MQLDFLDLPRSLADVALPKDVPERILHVRYRGSDVTGIALQPASGGIIVQPAHVVLALPGWEDAFEFVVDGELHTLFDIEKAARMLLHGSHLAMELLGSTASFVEGSGRSILQWTLNRRHLEPALDSGRHIKSTEPGADTLGDLLDHLRRFLQGHALADGAFGLHIDHLAEHLGVEFEIPDYDARLDAAKVACPTSAATLQALRIFVEDHPLDPEETALPETPTDYDALSEWVVYHRLEPV